MLVKVLINKHKDNENEINIYILDYNDNFINTNDNK